MVKEEMKVLDGGNAKDTLPEIAARVYEVKTVDTMIMNPADLFDGFDELYAITFSYNLNFMEKILPKFNSVQILIGFTSRLEKDQSAQEILVRALAETSAAEKTIAKFPQIVEMMSEGFLEIRVPDLITDHRKVYAMKSEDGRRRVIVTSANFTGDAWKMNGQLEIFEFDDTELRFECAMEDFEAAWDMAIEIPYDAVISRKGNLLKDNPIIRSVKEKNEAIVLQDSGMPVEKARYAVEVSENIGTYHQLLENMKVKKTDGKIVFSATHIKYMERRNRKKIKSSSDEIIKVPEITFDFGQKKMYFGQSEADLKPPKEDVFRDIETLAEVLANYASGDFVDTRGDLAETHFKLLNLLFCSPFHAPLRFELALRDRCNFASLPLFALITSESARSGKSFMIKLALKLMTDKNVALPKKKNVNKNRFRAAMDSVKGCPFAIDEVDNRYLSTIEDLIKDDDLGGERCFSQLPLIIMAGNDVNDPDEKLRRRMVFLKVGGALKSTVDPSVYEARGNILIKQAGNALYRAYAGEMLEKIEELLSSLDNSTLPDVWYPDLMKISSEVLLGLFAKYGKEFPCAHVLEWNRDYVASASKSAIYQIIEEYKHNKKAFSKDGASVIIKLGSSKEQGKKVKSWMGTLPPELLARDDSKAGEYILTIKNGEEFEKMTGLKITRRSFRR